MSSFITTLSLQDELLNSHQQFFFTKIRPYQVLTFIRTTLWAFTLTGAYHSAFENLSWKFVLAGFDGLWIRIYCQKIDICISKMADSKWRIKIYEIKRFRSLKTLTRGFRNCWLRKWGGKIEIFIYKMAGRFKMANWNFRGKQ